MPKPNTPTEAECLAILRSVRPDIITLDLRGLDDLDFHELSVGSIEQIIKAAYQAGYEAALPGVAL